MDRLFLQIINMSITSSYVILFIIIIRLFLKKAPKVFSYGLWAIPFFRLIFPFSFESIFSLISVNTETIPENIIYSQTPKIESGIRAIDSAVNRVLPVVDVSSSVNPIQIWVSIGSTIWIIGLVALLVCSIYSTIKLSRELKSATLIRNNIYRIHTIKTAFVFGLIKPRIYLPNNLSKNEESYIIKHEETHIKRFDHIIKFIAFLIVSIHWFNPIVWLAFYLMSEDMELSCDEAVIREMGYGIKREYSNLLLSLSLGRRIIGGSPLAFGENNTKGRIKNILNFKEPKVWVIIPAMVIVLALAVGLLTNRPDDEDIVMDNYINEEYGFGFKILDAWKGKAEKLDIVEAEDGSSVTFRYLFDQDGRQEFQEFFSITVIPMAEYVKDINSDMPMIGYLLAEKDEEVYLIYEPLDNIILDSKEQEEFQEMFLSTDDIKEGFYLRNSNEVEEIYINTKGDYMGYINDIDISKDILSLDRVEFLTKEDEERAAELDIDIDEDMPSGFMIYNPETDFLEFKVRDDTDYMLLVWTGDLHHRKVAKEYFIEYNNSLDYKPLYSIFVNNGNVILIKEEYIP